MLFGHSMGGWLALAGAADDANVSCTIAFAPWNIGHFGALQTEGKPITRRDFLVETKNYTDPEAGPLRGTTAQALADEAKAHPKDWDFVAFAPALAGKSGLVITSKKDTDNSAEMVTPAFEEALRRAHAARWTFRAFDDDHSFSAHRIEAARSVIAWLDQNCGAAH